MATLERDSTIELLDMLSELMLEHFEILKAHHPDGPQDCPICSAEAPGMLARLEQALSSIEHWRRANS